MNDFDRDLLIVLNDVARLVRTRFDQRARSTGMTRAQWIILARLQRQPGISQNELATICEVEPITIGRLVDRLEARGMLERRADPSDRRIRRLHLLPASDPIIKEIFRYKAQLHREITGGLDEAACNALTDGLLRIKEQLNTDANGADHAAAGE
jgi:MarR family transcriptional regulator for hemolysin